MIICLFFHLTLIIIDLMSAVMGNVLFTIILVWIGSGNGLFWYFLFQCRRRTNCTANTVKTRLSTPALSVEQSEDNTAHYLSEFMSRNLRSSCKLGVVARWLLSGCYMVDRWLIGSC